ncbi:AAA family ATPase [Fusobacterium sp. HC1336]|jgi:hypothetical protein|uniref:AAA family ATPase n=1 Tax=Fusobacterium sp. HC1336 TaxID=3171169 RepID=UPI003F23F16C
MGKSLNEIAKELKDNDNNKNKKVQLIYAFNGVGKTRLSKEFKALITSENGIENSEELENKKVLYYNAFTEDLFYWDNDLENNMSSTLKIHPNKFTKWIFIDQGQDQNVISTFQGYTNRNLNPSFNGDFSEVTFAYKSGDNQEKENIKISKGEESCFVWSIFYTFMKEVLIGLNDGEETSEYSNLEYIFIDDPVTSLDDNHLIQLAVDLAETIKQSKSKVKFIITTHNPLFFNVLTNEFSIKNEEYGYKKNKFKGHNLKKLSDGTYLLTELKTDSPFSYHLFLKNEIERAIETDDIRKYHYNFLRNILEKTATFLGYTNIAGLLKAEDGTIDNFVNRIINLSSHSKVASDEASELSLEEKDKFKEIFEQFIEKYHFGKEEVNE